MFFQWKLNWYPRVRQPDKFISSSKLILLTFHLSFEKKIIFIKTILHESSIENKMFSPWRNNNAENLIWAANAENTHRIGTRMLSVCMQF